MPLIHEVYGEHALIDLDGCVANCEHRIEFAHAKQWDNFHARCLDDESYEAECMIVRAWAAAGGYVSYSTGRTEPYRSLTLEWLRLYKMPLNGALYMRGGTDRRPSVVLKKEIAERHRAEIDPIRWAMDDKDDVVAMYRALGIACLQPRNGAY